MNWKRLTALLCAVLLTGTVCLQPVSAASAADVLQIVTDTVTGTTSAAGTSAGTADRTLQANFGEVGITQTQSQTAAATVYIRLYTMPQDTSCSMTRVVPASALSGEVDSTVIPGKLQMVRWLDEESGNWAATTDLSSVPATAAVLFVQTDEASAVLYAPAVYEERENEMIEELTDCTTALVLSTADDGVQVSWQVENVPAGAQIEIFCTISAADLVDWTDQAEAAAWKDLLLTGDNRWTYDGYYYRTPSTYYPTGDNYFHRIPDPYITLKMLDEADSWGAVVMSVSMLDVMLELMNDAGYYPTYALSTWLQEDYGIEAGYFDTRWNADLTLGLLDAWELTGIEEFLTYAVENGEFWLSYIPAHSTTVTSSSGAVTGLLVEDYWQPAGNAAVHTSLNHQLAEILMLYRLGDVTEQTTYTDLADQLLDGVRALGLEWVKSDYDLWYRIDPDGTMTGSDYQTLTYDDMYKLQQYLVQSGRGRDAVLSALMTYKKSWMDTNGITDYLQ